VKHGDNDNGSGPSDDGGVIVLENITKKFGTRTVLDNISLAVEKGKTTVIIGPSGCGKTVLVKHLIVLLRPNSGEVYFKNQRIDNLSEKLKGRVPELYVIGDAKEPRTAFESTHEGAEVARRI